MGFGVRPEQKTVFFCRFYCFIIISHLLPQIDVFKKFFSNLNMSYLACCYFSSIEKKIKVVKNFIDVQVIATGHATKALKIHGKGYY